MGKYWDGYGDIPYHQIRTVLKARFIETGRKVNVRPVEIQPNEEAPCTLPYHGRTASEYLKLVLSGDLEYATGFTNLTNKSIVIYWGEWNDNGLPAGFFWHSYLVFESEE